MPDGSKCRKLVGHGTINYPCVVEIPAGSDQHEGPCACNEIPSTKTQRAAWLRAQAAAGVDAPPVPVPAPAPEPAPAPVQQVPQPEMEASRPVTSGYVQTGPAFIAHEQRLELALQSMHRSYDDLPLALRSWAMGAVTQLALVDLWRVFTAIEAQGGDSITLRREDLEALIPPKLRN